MGIQINGLISGLDTGSLISALIELERTRVYQQEQKQEQLQAKQKAWQQVRSSLDTIQSKLSQLRYSTVFRSRKVELGDKSVATVTADAGAVQSSYSLQVLQLAQTHVIATSRENLYAAADEALGLEGSFQIGTDPDNLVTIEVEAEDTLSSIANSINEKDCGVVAYVVAVDGQYRLVLSASKSGEKNAIRLQGAEALFGEFDTLSSAQDAEIKLNGQNYSSETNTFTDVLPGIKITVNKPTGDDVVAMTVSADYDQAVQVIKEWVSAINSLQDQLSKLTAYDAEKKTSSALTGESLVRSIQYYLRKPFAQEVKGLPSSLNTLSQIGISTGAYNTADYGKIVVDEKKLREVLERDPEGVAKLFGLNEDAVYDDEGQLVRPAYKGVAVEMYDYIWSLLESDGLIASREETLAKQIKRIQDTIEGLELRLEQREKLLRQQYTRLEEALAKLQSQSPYLQAMFKAYFDQGS